MKKNKNNPLIFSQSRIMQYLDLTSYNKDNFSSCPTRFFIFENMLVAYDFKTQHTVLFRQVSDKNYKLLYEETSKDGKTDASLFDKDSLFILSGYDKQSKEIESLQYIPVERYFELTNGSKNALCRLLIRIIPNSEQTLSKHFNCIPLVINDTYYIDNNTKDYFESYKRVSTKYSSASTLIPAYVVLNYIMSDVNQYISTKQLDKEALKIKVSQLHFFEDFCPNSIQALISFLQNPSNTDLRDLSETLNKNITNINNLIHMYLEDELEIKSEKESI